MYLNLRIKEEKKITNIIFIAVAVAIGSVGSAHNALKGRVIDASGEPIIGANIVWDGTSIGGVTNIDGDFAVVLSSSTNRLTISYVAHTSETVEVNDPTEFIEITLQGELSLDEVVVSARRSSTHHSRMEPLQLQKITTDELFRAACCNLSESFETNPSVDVTYGDATTGARQIKLLGLSGNYVQMLTEQVPNLQGAASSFGLNYVPGSWMDGIQVSKGTSSVKHGYQALAGQINID